MRGMISWLAQGVAMNYAKNVQLRTGKFSVCSALRNLRRNKATRGAGVGAAGATVRPGSHSAQTMTIHRFAVGSWTWATMPTAAEIGGPRDPDSTTYTGAIEGTEEFGRRICAEAWGRGWSRALKRVVLGDGAE